jgi:8-oxo-dGTP diphosphatase
MKKIEVVAAAIFSPCGEELFIARRLNNAHQGGLWEFPGGKKEQGETAEAALVRELKEEIGITVLSCTPLIKLAHDYGDKLIELDVYRVDEFSGKPFGAEGQKAQWIKLKELNRFEFPEANKAIVDLLLQA